MKLYTQDQSELMEVTTLKAEGNTLIVAGTIMGAVPIEAILTAVELRAAFKLLNFRIIFSILKMLVAR